MTVVWIFLYVAALVVLPIMAPTVVHLAVVSRRLAPLLVAISSGVVSAILLQHRAPTIPTAVRVVCLPVLIAAILSIASCRKADWESLRFGPPIWRLRRNSLRDVLIVSGGVLGAVLGCRSLIGLSLLRVLDQDVIGTTPGEVQAIQIVGGIFGFIAGCHAFLILWVMAVIVMARQQEDKADRRRK